MKMSETKRTKDEVQSEYGQICAKAGHAQYQIDVLKRDLTMLNERLRDLNLEAAAIARAEEEAKNA